MSLWELPKSAVIGGKEYEIRTDFRKILQIIEGLNNPDTPEWIRWHIAIGSFFVEKIPAEHSREAMDYLANFISYQEQESKPGPILMDWNQDAKEIVSDVNKVAGQEIRAMPYLHWWTFLSYFHAIGEGQFSTIVSIRDKMRKGKQLEKWEKEFYRDNKSKVDLKKRYSAEEIAEREALEKLLG